MEWDASLYERQHGFIAEYGESLLQYIPQNKDQSILDLGCGTGTLTSQLKQYGRRIAGVDSSQTMIEKAKEKYSDVEFLVCDALDLPFEKEWDIIFSNAVFHWIDDHDVLLRNIFKALKPRGKLICEFGAAGNISAIEQAFQRVTQRIGCDFQSKFYFPTVETFGERLQKNGFMIEKLYDFDRPTPLQGAEKGLNEWMRQFYASELGTLSEETQKRILKAVEQETRDVLWDGKEWVADYRRLRVVAYI